MTSWFLLVACLSVASDGMMGELSGRLESRSAATRRVAIRALGELDSKEAYALILPHLADEDGEVADEAQWQLAGMKSPDLFFGRAGLRSSDAWVRLRTAELLGRMSCSIEARALSRHLSRRSADQSAALLWSLERLARGDLLCGDLEGCGKEVARAVRYGGQAGASALLCLEALGGSELNEELEWAIKRGDPLIRAAAAEASARRSDQKDWGRIESLACDEDPGVRRVLVNALALKPDLRKVNLLIDRLEAEEISPVRERILALLRAWSGTRHRYDPRPWRDWARSLSDEWRPVDSDEVEADVEVPMTRSFAGLPVSSSRLCVLVDLSGSIRTEMRDGVTRRDYVESELEGLLMRLPESARFNLIAFSDDPHPWRSALEFNRRGKASDAMKWFLRLSLRGKGDLFSAAELALTDPLVDTLLVFTDGVPTGGRRWRLNLMGQLLEQECRFRGVSIDSILVGASPRTVTAWEEISARTGGRSVQVSLE